MNFFNATIKKIYLDLFKILIKFIKSSYALYIPVPSILFLKSVIIILILTLVGDYFL
jgi:hypothetical protein